MKNTLRKYKKRSLHKKTIKLRHKKSGQDFNCHTTITI